MTDQTPTTTSSVPVVVPDGKHYTDLTVGELDYASRELKADVLAAIAGHDGTAHLRWGAMARAAWLWARRTNPQAKLQTFLDYETEDLIHALGEDRPQDDAPDPTPPSGS